MSGHWFLLFHIAVSLIAIAAGFIVVGGFLTRSQLNGATQLFLAASVATNVTGLMFPFTHFLPSHAVAIISLLVLAIALFAYYFKTPSRRWHRIFVGTAITALYLNVFVLIAQTFAKNPGLVALAPTQSEPPFALSQIAALIAFAAIAYVSMKRAAASS